VRGNEPDNLVETAKLLRDCATGALECQDVMLDVPISSEDENSGAV
jgi:hypothetical protein